MSISQVPLNEAFWFQEGPGVRKWQFTTSGIKLLNVANIVKDGTIDLSRTDRHLSEEEVSKKYSHFLVDSGDLVIASSGITIDSDGFLRTRGGLIEERHLPLCMNTSTIRFKSINGTSDLSYLRHWLQSFEFRSQITREVTGIAQKNFGPSHLKRLRISLPPLAEQKRIAGILDAADALRVKRRESLAQLDTLLQSTFLDMFGDPVTNPMGWETHALQELIQPDRPITYGILKPGPDIKGGVPYVRVVDIKNEQVLTDQLRRTTQEIASQYKRSQLIAGDLLMSIRGHVGRMAIVPATGAGANITQDTARLALFAADPAYVMQCISTPGMQQHMARRTKGVAVKGINLGDVKKIPIPVPSLDLQHRFAAIVESVEQQKASQCAHLDELNTLFGSLQSRSFRGDL